MGIGYCYRKTGLAGWLQEVFQGQTQNKITRVILPTTFLAEGGQKYVLMLPGQEYTVQERNVTPTQVQLYLLTQIISYIIYFYYLQYFYCEGKNSAQLHYV